MDKKAFEVINALEEKLRESEANAMLRLIAIEPGLCERGHTLLINDEGRDFVAYFRIEQDKWLLVSWHESNYPSLHLSVIFKPEDELAKFIQEEFDGWKAKPCNIAGVSLTDGCIGILDSPD
jgi:hypothetical protein